MTDLTPAPTLDAYELLSKPVLDLTDAEVELIVIDLRKRRANFLATPSKPDKPVKAKAVASPKPDDAQKKANTAILLASLKLPEL